MKIYFHIVGILGLFIAVYGIVSAVLYSSAIWYSYFVIGGTLFLAWTNKALKNDSLFEKSAPYLVKTYGIYLVLTILIEIIGRFLLGFWHYPYFGLEDKVIHVFLIGYPFAFFFIHESFKLIRKKVQLLPLTIVLATFINAFLHEIPNTFAGEWVYTVPYITFEVLQINIVVLFGWVILVVVPLITKTLLDGVFRPSL